MIISANEETHKVNINIMLDSGRIHNLDNLIDPEKIFDLRFSKDILVIKAESESASVFRFVSKEEQILLPLYNEQHTLSSDSVSIRHHPRNPIVFLKNGYYSLLIPKKPHISLFAIIRRSYFNYLLDDTVDLNQFEETDCITYRRSINNRFPIQAQDISDLIANKKTTYLNLKMTVLHHLQNCLDLLTASDQRAYCQQQLKSLELDRVAAVKRIIDERFKENLTIGRLAREVGTNEQYLKRHFKIAFGSTVYQYILRRRMECAKEYLSHPNSYKVGEVAELTGYKYATHFTKTFKKYFGMKPAASNKLKTFADKFLIVNISLEAFELGLTSLVV